MTYATSSNRPGSTPATSLEAVTRVAPPCVSAGSAETSGVGAGSLVGTGAAAGCPVGTVVPSAAVAGGCDGPQPKDEATVQAATDTIESRCGREGRGIEDLQGEATRHPTNVARSLPLTPVLRRGQAERRTPVAPATSRRTAGSSVRIDAAPLHLPGARHYPDTVHPTAEKVLAREVRGVARACRMVDDRVDGYVDMLKDLFPHTGNAWIVGVTGNPGAGKSTLTDRLIEHWRGQGKRLGVVAVDPTSPFSGGAILGDRIRMQRHFEDPEVFIRSLATRGALGGLSRSAADTVRVLDAWGADVVLVETVGVGQDELEVTRAAHTTLVVMAPGMGDGIQAIKAGILEVADVFAVNKADRDGADATVRDLELMIALGQGVSASTKGHMGSMGYGSKQAGATNGVWVPPITRCVATQNRGIGELVGKLDEHRAWLFDTEQGQARMQQRLREQMYNELREALVDAAVRDIHGTIERIVGQVASRELDPYTACEHLVEVFKSGK